jgi:hypothetical protein
MLRLGPPLKGGSLACMRRGSSFMLAWFGANVYIHLSTCAKTLCKITNISILCACIILANSQHNWEGTFVINLERKRNKFPLQLVIAFCISTPILDTWNENMYALQLLPVRNNSSLHRTTKITSENWKCPQEGHLFRAMFGEILWHNGLRS